MVPRKDYRKRIETALRRSPIVALLGPRQCGKTTLARVVARGRKSAIFDLGKDLPDIAYLSIIHNLNLEADIRPLCDRFGTQEVYDLIRRQLEALRAP